MGHSIRAIIASPLAAGALRGAWPAIPSAPLRQGFVAFPIEADDVDVLVSPGLAPEDDGFLLLTGPFRDFLSRLSHFGPLAYVETDYFGGVGEQAAVAFAGGVALKGPGWGRRGAINQALRSIGVRRGPVGDRFSALGLTEYRSNDALRDAADRAHGAAGEPTG